MVTVFLHWGMDWEVTIDSAEGDLLHPQVGPGRLGVGPAGRLTHSPGLEGRARAQLASVHQVVQRHDHAPRKAVPSAPTIRVPTLLVRLEYAK